MTSLLFSGISCHRNYDHRLPNTCLLAPDIRMPSLTMPCFPLKLVEISKKIKFCLKTVI